MGGRSGNLDIRRAMRRGRIALLAAVTLGLSGCLVSEEPLIAPGEAAFPLPNQASAERFKPGDNGWEHDEDDSARRDGSRYVLTTPSGAMELTFRRIAENTYMVQSRTDPNADYIYGLIVVDGGKVYEYGIDCTDFDATELLSYGIVKKDNDDCTVTSANGLAAGSLAVLRKGKKPNGLYVLR